MKNITVQELRNLLRDMPDDALVTVPIDDGAIGTIDSVYIAKAKLHNGWVYPPNHYEGELVTIVVLE